jgi:predicted phosphate transport protein (TIGR00153 family)
VAFGHLRRHPVRLIPRDEGFFVLFNELAKRLKEAARLLTRLLAEPDRLEHYVAAIKTVEHEADVLTHDVRARIDRSFVTPIDREDIHLLATELDDVIDLIDGTARRVAMFHIAESREPAQRLGDTIAKAADRIEAGVAAIKQPAVVSECSREIKRLEEQGDAIYQEAVGALFLGQPDALEVMKWKEVYDTLERALDQCQGVGHVLESISLKNS